MINDRSTLGAVYGSVIREDSDGEHGEEEPGTNEQYNMDLRRVVDRVRSVQCFQVVVCRSSWSGCRRCPGDSELESGGWVDGPGLEVGAAVTATTAARRGRPTGRTSPVLDALRLRLVSCNQKHDNRDDFEVWESDEIGKYVEGRSSVKQEKTTSNRRRPEPYWEECRDTNDIEKEQK